MKLKTIDSIEAHTGKRLITWYAILDDAHGPDKSTEELVEFLRKKRSVPELWAHCIARSYRKDRGMPSRMFSSRTVQL